MNQDNPDTVMMDEQSHWEATQMEDVFLPSVRVQLGWSDVENAVDQGAIVPAQAHALWASWALPGSATRLGAGETHPESVDVDVNPGSSAEAGDLPQAALQWGGHGACHHIGAGTGVKGEYLDNRVIHLRQRRDRQEAIAQNTGEQHRQHQQ